MYFQAEEELRAREAASASKLAPVVEGEEPNSENQPPADDASKEGEQPPAEVQSMPKC